MCRCSPPPVPQEPGDWPWSLHGDGQRYDLLLLHYHSAQAHGLQAGDHMRRKTRQWADQDLRSSAVGVLEQLQECHRLVERLGRAADRKERHRQATPRRVDTPEGLRRKWTPRGEGGTRADALVSSDRIAQIGQALDTSGPCMSQVHFHFSESMAVKRELHLRLAIYLAAVSMLMGWVMRPTVSCRPLSPPTYRTGR
jgi:hypothetical protein